MALLTSARNEDEEYLDGIVSLKKLPRFSRSYLCRSEVTSICCCSTRGG